MSVVSFFSSLHQFFRPPVNARKHTLADAVCAMQGYAVLGNSSRKAITTIFNRFALPQHVHPGKPCRATPNPSLQGCSEGKHNLTRNVRLELCSAIDALRSQRMRPGTTQSLLKLLSAFNTQVREAEAGWVRLYWDHAIADRPANMQFYEAKLAICQLQRAPHLNELFQLVIRSGNVSEEDCTRLRRMFHWELLLPGAWEEGVPHYQARDFERLTPNSDHIGLVPAKNVLRQARLDNERNPDPVAQARMQALLDTLASTLRAATRFWVRELLAPHVSLARGELARRWLLGHALWQREVPMRLDWWTYRRHANTDRLPPAIVKQGPDLP